MRLIFIRIHDVSVTNLNLFRAPSQEPNPSPISGSNSQQPLSAGAIAGIVVCFFVVLIFFWAATLEYRLAYVYFSSSLPFSSDYGGSDDHRMFLAVYLGK